MFTPAQPKPKPVPVRFERTDDDAVYAPNKFMEACLTPLPFNPHRNTESGDNT